MNIDTPRDGLQLRSIVKDSGELELSLARVATPAPAASASRCRSATKARAP